MKQINLPFVANTVSSRGLISIIITYFSMYINENSDYVDMYIEAKDYADTLLKFNASVEHSVAEYYKECYETKQPINILAEKVNYLIFTPDIDIV